MLKIDEQTAKKLYPAATGDFKELLENSFTKDALVPPNIIILTPTVEAALALTSKTIEGLTRATDSKHETACRIIEAVIEVLNEGVPVYHSNDEQTKYEPRFIYKPGLGLSFDSYGHWAADTGCGPRLCYLKYHNMLHGIKILAKYYNDYLN